MPVVRLGKMVLRWCHNCNLPILTSKICSSCGKKTHHVECTPPGDIRPAFDFDIEMIKKTIDDQFGAGCGAQFMPENGVVILNHAPDLDKLEEIIFNGQVQGALRFELINGKLRFLPRLAGAKRFLLKISKGFVTVDDGAIKPILNGSSALVPGIEEVSEGIEVGDELVVCAKNGKLLGLGSAQMSTSELLTLTRGMGVKIRWHETMGEHMNEYLDDRVDEHFDKQINEQGTKAADESVTKFSKRMLEVKDDRPIYKNKGWELTIEANRLVLDRMIENAKEFINSTIKQYQLPVAVSFSGGKDSLALLMLVLEANIKPNLFFIDTGLEFPETVEHVRNISKNTGLKLITGKPNTTFWSGLDYFGPPGKDYRWCCKTCKLGPTTQLIKTHFPDGVLVFIGQRRYESEQRSQKGKVWKNPWVPGQLAASPIQDWSALHIWIYIFSKLSSGYEFNPLYEHGLERIGCWLCPASDMADFITVSKNHPDYNRWLEYLNEYSKAHGLTDNWVNQGLWRWKKLPKGIRQLLKLKGIKIQLPDDECLDKDQTTSDEMEKMKDTSRGLQLFLTDGFIDCEYGLSQEGMFNKGLDMPRVVNMTNIIGKPQYDVSNGYCTIIEMLDIFPEGSIVVKGKSIKEIKKKTSKIHAVVLRAMECISCGICIGRCENNALILDDSDKLGRIKIIEERCTHCGNCLGPCPVVNYIAPEEYGL